MCVQSVAEHVSHHQQVGVLTLHSDSVHGQELGEQRAAMTGDDVLEEDERPSQLHEERH